MSNIQPDADGFEGSSPVSSFGGANMSIEKAEFTDSATTGIVLGFLVFGIAILITIVWIFVDINKMSL